MNMKKVPQKCENMHQRPRHSLLHFSHAIDGNHAINGKQAN